MANQWFKFYASEFLNDLKVKYLTASERMCLVTLMCLASTNSNDGVLHPLTEQGLMIDTGITPGSREWNDTKGILKKLASNNIVTISNDTVTLINWKKRQDSSLTNAERQRNFRERNKVSNAIVTLDKNRIEENRIDKRRKKKEDIAPKGAVQQKEKKPEKDPNEKLSFEKYLESMRASPHRYIRLIGEYADEIKPKLETRGQWNVFTRRNVRAAKELEVFTDQQIEKAMTMVEKDFRTKNNPKGFITNWGMETILKYITK